MPTNEYDVKYNRIEWIGTILLVLVLMGGCNTCNYIDHLENDSIRKYEKNEGTDIHSESVLP